MNNKNETDFSYYLHRFFNEHLDAHRRVSIHTVESYSWTFALLLEFFQAKMHLPPQKVAIHHISKDTVLEFLSWLEQERGNSLSTRNQRLTVIRSFFRYLQTQRPEYMWLASSVLSIKGSKVPKPAMNYLSHDGIKLLLEQPDLSTMAGRRDMVLLSLLYDTAARVSEIIYVKAGDLMLSNPSSIRLTGKGQKTRLVPLMTQSVKHLKKYLSDMDLQGSEHSSDYLFVNRSHQPLTRGGVAYILKKYCDQVRQIHPEQMPDRFSPHCLRHSKAMHLLQAGNNLIYIRDILGHVDVSTTEIYAKAD